jgi:hypothetical protein
MSTKAKKDKWTKIYVHPKDYNEAYKVSVDIAETGKALGFEPIQMQPAQIFKKAVQLLKKDWENYKYRLVKSQLPNNRQKAMVH